MFFTIRLINLSVNYKAESQKYLEFPGMVIPVKCSCSKTNLVLFAVVITIISEASS